MTQENHSIFNRLPYAPPIWLWVFTAIFIALSSLAVGGYNYYSKSWRPVHLAKEAVLEKLNDPNSAQFRNLRIGKSGDLICGEVNAKNRMGGYVGFVTFMATVANRQGEIQIVDLGIDEQARDLYRELCDDLINT